MKKNIILSCLLGVGSIVWGQQVGINANTDPKALLEIGHTSNAGTTTDPTSTAVIIPRVTQLYIPKDADPKPEKGMLVFLEKKKNETGSIDRGFYWWDGTKWNPFLSTAQISINRTISYVAAKKTFDDDLNYITSETGKTEKTISFDDTSLKTHNKSDFSFTNGKLVINKAGYYSINSTVYLFKENAAKGAVQGMRDMFRLDVMVNDAPTKLTAVQSFPFGLDRGVYLIASGAIKLNKGDTIHYKVSKEYKDTNPNRPAHKIIINPSVDSNIVLQYLGDF